MKKEYFKDFKHKFRQKLIFWLLLVMVLLAFKKFYWEKEFPSSSQEKTEQNVPQKPIDVEKLKKYLEPQDTLKPSQDSIPIEKQEFEFFASQKANDWTKLPDSALVDIEDVEKSIILDIRYATTDNFMKTKVYPCAKCLLRKKVAVSLQKAAQKFKTKGYRIKIFDGYRPLSVQWELWNRITKKGYVADPRKGSNHNKGCAVDMTLIDTQGKELDMGTPYDYFGKEAHITYTNLPRKVLENRKLLRSIMESEGFKAISNEWWHFDYTQKYGILNIPLPCQK